ncbi:hypothetical protein ACVGOW_09065 [Pseudonocardia saturnea]
MKPDPHDSTPELPIVNNTRHAKNNNDQNHKNYQQHDDDNHRDDTRSTKTKSKTHTHASRSCGARREPWRARSELLRRARNKINISGREDQ